MRQLERLGHCTEVEVEIVPLSKVPPNVVQEMEFEQGANGCHGALPGVQTKKQCRVRCRAAQRHRRMVRAKHTVCSQHSHSCCLPSAGASPAETESAELKPQGTAAVTKNGPAEPCSPSTATTSSPTTSFSLNGFNTYLSDQQLRAARMSNTMTVMAPCLRQPITTSTPASDLSMRQFKWHFCCAERERHRGKPCQNTIHKSGDHQCQAGNGNDPKRSQCDSASTEDAANAIPPCCICSVRSNGECTHTRVAVSCPSTSSHHHHCLHESTRTCHCAKSVQGCISGQHSHRSAKANCLNNNCQQRRENDAEEDEETKDDEEELSSDNEEEDEEEEEDEDEENGQKDNCKGEESDEEENESNEEEEEEEEEEEDEEDEENAGNSFEMRVLRRSGSVSDEEAEEGEEEDQEEMESCLQHEDELFACNVCDRTYHTARSLAKHQVHKRHFGCSICDTVFPTLLSLEQHKHTLEHWSDDDESTLSLSLSGSTSKHHCTVNRASHSMQQLHNHPILANSSHGYPSDSLHLHNHAHNGDQQSHQSNQTKLSLHNTTIAGLLEGKWSPSQNGQRTGGVDHLTSNRKWSLGTQHRGEQSLVESRCRTAQPASHAKASKPILASSLSSKLMASVFNFSSSNASMLSMHAHETSRCKPPLNSHKRLSRSAEEMESLL